jgi:site-specific DNA-methyltransferase (adenine-specific)
MKIGNATILNIDCMEYLATLPDKSFELAIVDPPYGIGESGANNKTRSNLAVSKDYKPFAGGDICAPDISYFKELQRVSINQIIWGANYMPALLKGGVIVWDKVNDGSDQSGAEIAYCSLNDRVDIVRYMWRGMMQGESIANGTVQQGNKSLNEERIHPAQKPTKLYEFLLANYAKPGDRILDTHLGSGSSAIAANNLGFEFVGCELDADYYAAACKRIEHHTKQMRLFA